MFFLRFIVLLLIFLNFPSWSLVNISSFVGSSLNYITFIFILIFFIKSEYKINLPSSLIILGFLYFSISLFLDSSKAENVLFIILKYFLFISAFQTLINDSSDNELLLILFIGSCSIFYEILTPKNFYGRFSGFYLNPNPAGFVCLVGFWFSNVIKSKYFKIILKVIFLTAGLATLSRTFGLIFIVTILISSFSNRSNLYYILGVFLGLLIFISFAYKLNFNSYRLAAIQSLINGQISDNLTEDRRTDTWKKYYNIITNNPIFGIGYLKLSGKTNGYISTPGVHNTPLMILGEAGILPFLFFIYFYGKNLIISFKQSKYNDYYIILITIILYLFTSHNFFDNYIILGISLWVSHKIKNQFNLTSKF
jgi:O-antigen ligase